MPKRIEVEVPSNDRFYLERDFRVNVQDDVLIISNPTFVVRIFPIQEFVTQLLAADTVDQKS